MILRFLSYPLVQLAGLGLKLWSVTLTFISQTSSFMNCNQYGLCWKSKTCGLCGGVGVGSLEDIFLFDLVLWLSLKFLCEYPTSHSS